MFLISALLFSGLSCPVFLLLGVVIKEGLGVRLGVVVVMGLGVAGVVEVGRVVVVVLSSHFRYLPLLSSLNYQ